MPLVKVIRNGQITIPKGLRATLGIREGDFLEIKLRGRQMVVIPKVAIDKELSREKFFRVVDEIRASVKDADPEEITKEIDEAVQTARKPVAKKIKARAKK
ncbi:MAG: AbrB/MazE/SpoVT family DNA-binding domain-containing protein [Desulfobacterales bacterium]